LGWEPQHANLKDILSSAWEWHKSHPKGYESIRSGGAQTPP